MGSERAFCIAHRVSRTGMPEQTLIVLALLACSFLGLWSEEQNSLIGLPRVRNLWENMC